jgi:tRNA pseudouridine38-40 synthase
MPRYFSEIAYDGAAYHGWQVQANAVTVQAVLEERLATLLQRQVETVGCGRTDTGVHAEQFFLHFDLPGPLPEDRDLVHALNRILPPDIAVQRVFPVADNAHARFDATERVYRYRVVHRKDPFLRFRHCHLPVVPDYTRMNAAARLLLGRQDFSCFSKAHTQTVTNDCTVIRAAWQETGKGIWDFEIAADRFLRNMVRAVVGTLLEIGLGRMDEQGLRDLLQSGSRQDAGRSMPAHGLSLVAVRYPFTEERRDHG